MKHAAIIAGTCKNKIMGFFGLHKKSEKKITGENISIRFTSINSRKSKIVDRCLINIGEVVAHKPGWKHGDKIQVFNHPDDLFSFMLVKNDKNGITLNKMKHSLNLFLQFPWKQPIAVEKHNSIVEYMIIEKTNQLVFRDNG